MSPGRTAVVLSSAFCISVATAGAAQAGAQGVRPVSPVHSSSSGVLLEGDHSWRGSWWGHREEGD